MSRDLGPGNWTTLPSSYEKRGVCGGPPLILLIPGGKQVPMRTILADDLSSKNSRRL